MLLLPRPLDHMLAVIASFVYSWTSFGCAVIAILTFPASWVTPNGDGLLVNSVPLRHKLTNEMDEWPCLHHVE